MHCDGRAGPEQRVGWRGQKHGAAGEAGWGELQGADEAF